MFFASTTCHAMIECMLIEGNAAKKMWSYLKSSGKRKDIKVWDGVLWDEMAL
jgi:hypothetical protein